MTVSLRHRAFPFRHLVQTMQAISHNNDNNMTLDASSRAPNEVSYIIIEFASTMTLASAYLVNTVSPSTVFLLLFS